MGVEIESRIHYLSKTIDDVLAVENRSLDKCFVSHDVEVGPVV